MQASGRSPGGMAMDMHVSPQTISRWLAGKTRPPMQALALWAHLTDLPIEW